MERLTAIMDQFSLVTPTLLFSAVSLIMLAYTNRFLSYATLVRKLKDEYVARRSEVTAAQISNLRKRLNLTRLMQLLCISSLLLCVVSMFLTFIDLRTVAVLCFGWHCSCSLPRSASRSLNSSSPPAPSSSTSRIWKARGDESRLALKLLPCAALNFSLGSIFGIFDPI